MTRPHLAAEYGASHLVLGSDYPLAAGLENPAAEVRALGLAPADEDLVLGGAAGLLGIRERNDLQEGLP